jgi:general secretion pathway protein D
MISLLAVIHLLTASLLFLQDPAPAPGGAAPEQDQARVQGQGDVPMLQDIGSDWLITFTEVDGEGAVNLEQFIKICQEQTGRNFVYALDTASVLQGTKVKMLGSKTIPKDDFYKFFQIIMIIHDFVCLEVGPKHLRVIEIVSTQTNQRGELREKTQYIEPEEIEEYADHPATMVSVVLHVPNLDARTLTNTLRALIADPNTLVANAVGDTHSVIITGFGSTVAGLARMLRLVDQLSEPEDPILPQFEVIPLEYASADEIADTLEELLEASRRASQAGQPRQGAQGATGALQRNTVETKIMVQPRTNSLLVMAMPEDMPRIKELVARLDIDTIERERNYHFIRLENADANAMAEVLEDFLQDASRVQQSGQPGAARAGGQSQRSSSSNEIAVVPDPATNSLLIAANRSRYQEVLELVSLLDRRQAQVLIETALIELAGSDVLDIGVELGGARLPDEDENGTKGYGGFGVADWGFGEYQDTDLDGIPDIKTPLIGSGLTAGIIDGANFSLPVLIKALETRRDTNVLNIPSVLVNNNGNATVKTLNERPKTSITANGQGQTQENFDGYEEAGITLEISPTISASNYVRLKITLEVSNFEGAFTGVVPPPRTTRNLDTIVNVPDGDTMVIGGIIVDNKTHEVRQVPFLGDIPLIGVLFQDRSDSEERTTLYFFVTPHIMHDREFADLASYSYKKKLEAADTIGSDRVRIISPDFGSDDGVMDLQGFKVPVYQAPTRGEVDQNELGLDTAEVNDMLDKADK